VTQRSTGVSDEWKLCRCRPVVNIEGGRQLIRIGRCGVSAHGGTSCINYTRRCSAPGRRCVSRFAINFTWNHAQLSHARCQPPVLLCVSRRRFPPHSSLLHRTCMPRPIHPSILTTGLPLRQHMKTRLGRQHRLDSGSVAYRILSICRQKYTRQMSYISYGLRCNRWWGGALQCMTGN